MNDARRPVIVVGGGWAGLAAAVELTRHDVPVILLEATRRLGGRARCIAFGEHRVDNGPHLMIGAYRGLLRMLAALGVDEDEVFRRRAFALTMLGEDDAIELPATRLPAPWHLAAAVARARGPSLRERLQALRGLRHLRADGFRVPQECSVAELLERYAQPPRFIEQLWRPLCIAALNTEPQRASAEIFARVLAEAFGARRADSDLLVARTALSDVVPSPAVDFIERRGGAARVGERVDDIVIDGPRVRGVHVARGETIDADQVVLAVPHTAAAELLAPHASLSPIADRLQRLQDEPICTVYLEFPSHVRLQRDMLGFTGSTVQWLFDRAVADQPGVMAAVISARGPHMELDNPTLARQVTEELARRMPEWPAPRRTQVVRERRAAFASRTGVNALRPGTQTPAHGLWLAGDYVATGLPGTLESAVRSGLQSAHSVLDARPVQVGSAPRPGAERTAPRDPTHDLL